MIVGGITHLQVLLGCVLLEEGHVSDGLENVVEHQVGSRNDVTLAVRRVVSEVVCLQDSSATEDVNG